MNNNLCFIIENKNLYLEQILVDYMDIPIFFLCKGEGQYFIALCTDIDELNYVVARLSLSDVYNLLHGKIPMRDIILKQNEYWAIESGDEINMDKVTRKKIDTLETTLLPEKNACFKILTTQIQLFVQKFDCDFFSSKYFSEIDKKADLSGLIGSVSLDVLFENIDNFTELADFKVGGTVFSKVPLYDEKMESIEKAEIVLMNSKQLNQTEMNDLFKLDDPCVNNITVAA